MQVFDRVKFLEWNLPQGSKTTYVAVEDPSESIRTFVLTHVANLKGALIEQILLIAD
jgi:hypothetical protein